MKRVVLSVIVSTFIVGFFSYGADAQRRRRRRAPPPAEQTPTSDQIAPALGELEWGWSKQKVIRHFTTEIRESYRPRLSKAPGAIEEDRLRHEMNSEIRRLRESYVEFRGRITGHDSGFLREEFTHNNREAMLRLQTERSDDYYFFINNRLWKWYRAFNTQVFAGADFEQFSGALQGRFGEGRERRGSLSEGGASMHWVEWQDENTRLRAVDNNQFYGFYCLVFEHKSTLENLATLRRNKRAPRARSHALVDAVTSGEGETADPDNNGDIVDRITGRIRNRQDAPEDSEGGGSSSSMRPRSVNDDPLSGL